MQKRRLHHVLKTLRSVPHWGLFVAGLVLIFVSVFSLRANNQTMVKLRDAVFVADERNGDVESALRDLREHVYSHMNTDLAAGNNSIRPPIQLKYRYERLVAAEQAKSQSGNDDLYSQAQEHCERTQPGGFSGSNRLPCVREYLDSHGVSTTEEVKIPDGMYKFDFVSPVWTPDLAGLSMVAAAICFSLLAVLLAVEYLIKRRLS